MNVEAYIRDVVDFPKKGIVFKDITPLLNSAEATEQMLQNLLQGVKAPIDKVIAIEARGFFFGSLLAQKLNAGFVPVRKQGKLPYKRLQESYALEYGTDILEIHQDAILPGERVLIHDDVLATGGTAEAVCKLVEKLGGEIVQCNFLIELAFLQGREKLPYEVKSVLKY